MQWKQLVGKHQQSRCTIRCSTSQDGRGKGDGVTLQQTCYTSMGWLLSQGPSDLPGKEDLYLDYNKPKGLMSVRWFRSCIVA